MEKLQHVVICIYKRRLIRPASESGNAKTNNNKAPEVFA